MVLSNPIWMSDKPHKKDNQIQDILKQQSFSFLFSIVIYEYNICRDQCGVKWRFLFQSFIIILMHVFVFLLH